ncbi:uncharacterized protein LOC100573366 [Acyrthosiphon pisum]|uniref:Endonuclease/exonuclease/phosphatase domain-containing protein n=1 Tax=Acyrthosiphon pisum TaxID=7029 RepID=A0A8R2FAN2_ACYPI|nr:uncharacterized protein LOC100573366 [Acyrthosiphon pisum]|eukprot:XP_008185534.1 PREDICTED: uncharacterized protein LOC100573366 [Acyrthosiphon pisum]
MELKDFKTGTWNVRTLYKPGNLTTAILELERYRLDIIAVQEIRWTGEGRLKTGNWTVFHSGGDEHQGGVGFIVNDKILHRVKKFKAVNDRICHMELECRWFNVILINGYAPTEDKEDEVKDIFYENLENECDRIPTNKANEIKNGFKTKAHIKDEEGLLITDKKKAANEFRNMFETMLNQPTQVEVEENLNTAEQRLDEPTLKEVERAVNMLKNMKAPGEDAIVAELLKEGGK